MNTEFSIKYSDFNIYEYLTIMQGLIITTNDAVSMHGLNDFNYFIAFSTSPEQKKSQCVKSSRFFLSTYIYIMFCG